MNRFQPNFSLLPQKSQQLVWIAGQSIVRVAAWWKIYRVIKAFYIVFICVLIQLRGSGRISGLSIIEMAMPWWSFILLIGAVILVLESGQPVWIYFGSLLPMFLYVLALVYGMIHSALPPVIVLPVVYLGFGCLGFVSGIYGTWCMRNLINRVVELEHNLAQLKAEVKRYATRE